jgi:hypothetical protein
LLFDSILTQVVAATATAQSNTLTHFSETLDAASLARFVVMPTRWQEMCFDALFFAMFDY